MSECQQMPDAEELQRRQSRIAEVAAEFTPPRPKRYAVLLPFADAIATLRSKGASYRAIAELLQSEAVPVSHDTVRRFCMERLEDPQPGRQKRRKTRRQTADRSGDAKPAERQTRQQAEHQAQGATQEESQDRQPGDHSYDANVVGKLAQLRQKADATEEDSSQSSSTPSTPRGPRIANPHDV